MNSLLAAFAIFFAAIFTNNILLTNYLGMCSFLAVSRRGEDLHRAGGGGGLRHGLHHRP